MNRGLNKVILIGILGRDPEMRYTPSGRPVTTFPLVISRNWNTSDGEKRSETEKFNIIAWSNLAEICSQFLNKDSQIYIEGRLHSRQWEDRDGGKHHSVEVVANEMIILGDKPDAHSNFDDGYINQDIEDFSF